MELELLKSGMLYIAAEPLRRPLPVTHSAANDGNDTVKVNKSIKMYEYTFSFYHIISHRDISSGTLATSASTEAPQPPLQRRALFNFKTQCGTGSNLPSSDS